LCKVGKNEQVALSRRWTVFDIVTVNGGGLGLCGGVPFCDLVDRMTQDFDNVRFTGFSGGVERCWCTAKTYTEGEMASELLNDSQRRLVRLQVHGTVNIKAILI